MLQFIWEGLAGTVARNLRQELKQRQEPYLLTFFLWLAHISGATAQLTAYNCLQLTEPSYLSQQRGKCLREITRDQPNRISSSVDGLSPRYLNLTTKFSHNSCFFLFWNFPVIGFES